MRRAYGKLLDAWHEAVNTRDLAAAQALVSDPVDVSGPRGRQLIPARDFAEWIIRSGIVLRPLATHDVDDQTVVVEQEAIWPDSDTPATVATVFEVGGGVITAIHRFDSLSAALDTARRG